MGGARWRRPRRRRRAGSYRDGPCARRATRPRDHGRSLTRLRRSSRRSPRSSASSSARSLSRCSAGAAPRGALDDVVACDSGGAAPRARPPRAAPVVPGVRLGAGWDVDLAPRPRGEVVALIDSLGVGGYAGVMVGRPAAGLDFRALASRAWDLDALDERYRALYRDRDVVDALPELRHARRLRGRLVSAWTNLGDGDYRALTASVSRGRSRHCTAGYAAGSRPPARRAPYGWQPTPSPSRSRSKWSSPTTVTVPVYSGPSPLPPSQS
jgi:hypothetical protein